MNCERPRKPDGSLVEETPCKHCPKKSPAEAHKFELSPKNIAAVEFYRRVRATGGACLNERMTEDETLMRNLTIIDDIIRAQERLASAGGLGIAASK